MISVIIPTYNSGKYICDALDSVLHQTYSAYEIIVVDDGSTDNTRAIIESGYQSVRYFHVPNNGVAAARNVGIAKALGDFVAFLDADDKWLPEKLEKQVALFEGDAKVGMVFTENSSFNDSGIIKEKENKRERLMQGDIVKEIFMNSYVVTSSVMVRKSVFDVVGLFEEELIVAEDDNMWMRIAMNYEVKLLDEPMLMYRITEGSLSQRPHAVFTGVKASINIIESKYPDLCKRLGKSAIRRKYSSLLFSEGYHFFIQGMQKEARRNFAKSYCNSPLKLKILLYMASTCFPHRIVEIIRGAKIKFCNQADL